MKISPSNFWRNTLHYIDHDIWPDFIATLKISILIRISSKLIHNIKTCMCIKKIYKIENSLKAILIKFGQRPCIIVQGL